MKAARGHEQLRLATLDFVELPKNGACAENGRSYVHLNIPQYYVETAVKTSSKGISVARIVPLVVS